MKETYVETMSIPDLEQLGYKHSETQGRIYVGNSKWPTHQFSQGLVHLLGKKLKIKDLSLNKYGRESHTLTVYDEMDLEYNVPIFLVKGKLPKVKKHHIVVKDREAYFSGYEFRFSCDHKNLNKAEAVKLAKWILKMAAK